MGQIAKATQGARLAPMNPQQNMRTLLERSWPRIAAVIGNNIRPDRLYQMYVSTLNREPQLAQCSVESVLSCFMKCASLGLEPSNVDGLGRAYILPFGNKNYRTGQKEATFVLGYKGMLDLARRSGEILDISARAVHEGDEFEYSYGLDETLAHHPCARPGRLTHVYMIAHFKDGGHYFQVMSADEVEAAMRRSPSGQKGPWKTDFEAMAKKTVIRRAFPYLPVSVEARQAGASDETTPDYSDVFHPVIAPAAPEDAEPSDRIAAAQDEAAEEPQDDPLEDRREAVRASLRASGFGSEDEAMPVIRDIVRSDVRSIGEMSADELDAVLAAGSADAGRDGE